MKMFADDTKLLKAVSSVSDSQAIQRDLDSLSAWSDKWLLRFNPTKCKVMHVGQSLNTRYFMRDGTGPLELQVVTEEKDQWRFVYGRSKTRTTMYGGRG